MSLRSCLSWPLAVVVLLSTSALAQTPAPGSAPAEDRPSGRVESPTRERQTDREGQAGAGRPARDFRPSEVIPAESSVSFPVDI